MNEPQKHYVKPKSDKRDHILYYTIYMKCPEKRKEISSLPGAECGNWE